jgi:hypothetical protein
MQMQSRFDLFGFRERGGAACRYAWSLFVGTVLVFGASSAVLGQSVPDKPKQDVSAQPAKADPVKNKVVRKKLVADLSGFELLKSGNASNSQTVVGATRGGAPPDALAPRLGKFYGPGAFFSWSNPSGASDFIFVITDDQDSQIFRTRVHGTNFVYPPAAPELQPGRIYSWKVASSGLLGGDPSDPVEFTVVSTAERQEIEKAIAAIPKDDDWQAGLARAQVLTDHRLWYDALGAYCALIARWPDRAELFEKRGTIYSQIEITKPLAEMNFAENEKLLASQISDRQ